MRSDIVGQLEDYRGVLTWNSFTEPYGSTFHPTVEIPLYLKEMSVPSRRPKITEIVSVTEIDSASGMEVGSNFLFWGAPGALSVTLTGFLITPMNGNVWAPVSSTGTALNLGNVNYADIISAYIEGRMNKTITGGIQRKDPDYFITPNGHKYIRPIITSFEPQHTTNARKMQFTMALQQET